MKLTLYKEQLNKITTIEQSVNSGLPSLVMLKGEYGEEDTLKAVCKKIKQVNDFFNLQRKMSHEQMWMTAKLILKDYYYMNLGDMKIVFENMLALRYGEYYGKIDGGDFLKAFTQHSEERLGIAEQVSLQQHSETKQRR